MPPGRWKSLRLRNVSAHATVAVKVATSGEIAVALVNADDYRRFPAVGRPLFSGRVEDQLSFSVTTPAAGNYFVVFDNRGGDAPRAVTVTVAVRGSHKGLTTAELRAAERQLTEFEKKLSQIFVYEPFTISVMPCDVPKASRAQPGVVLCTEYARALYASFGDRQKAGDALLFTFLHKPGHVVLAQWQDSRFESEEVADEFATALLVMFGRKGGMQTQLRYLAENPTVPEAIARAARDDRHLLSPDRARTALRLADDADLVRKWQPVLVPRMQTRMLEQLRQRPTEWADLDLVERELSRRPR